MTSRVVLKTSYCIDDGADNAHFEVGVDEAGRGPMFGRVYTGAVVLPKSMEKFNHALMKDSKKFHSDKKIREVAAYIKENAIAWSVSYADEKVIDEINIRRATHKAMHQSIHEIIEKLQLLVKDNNAEQILLLVDGNDFTTFSYKDNKISHVCIEGGDNAYSCIAAASILAKVARDEYIAELCAEQPDLITRYDLLKNKLDYAANKINYNKKNEKYSIEDYINILKITNKYENNQIK